MSTFHGYQGPNDPYKWQPENCPEIDGRFYFNVKWQDSPYGSGWIGKAITGETIYYSHDGEKRILKEREE